MKKFLALLLAIMMVMSLAVTVSADVDHNNHTITINKQTEGLEYWAYQLFYGDVTVNNNGTPDDASDDYEILANIAWGSGVDTAKTVNWGTAESPKELTLVQALKDNTVFSGAAYVNLALEQALQAAQAADSSVTELTANQVATAVVDAVANFADYSDDAMRFAEIVGEYLSTTYTVSVAEDAGYKITGLHDGYYLVKQNPEKAADGETLTDYMLNLIEDVSITPKDGTVTVDKNIIEGEKPVNVCSNNVGDVIEFEIEGTMPENLAEFDTFFYEFVDTMSEGLTLNADSIKVYTLNGDDEKEITDKSFYEILTGAEADKAHEGATLVVRFNDIKKLTASEDYTVHSTSKIVLKYTATLNEKAVIGHNGNPNEVYLVFDRDPYTGYEPTVTPPSIVHVFSFGLDVVKTDGENKKPLEGVKFVLYRERTGHAQYAVVENGVVAGWTNWLTGEDVEKYVKVTYPDLVDDAFTAKVDELIADVGIATELVTGADGKFNVKGLDLDLYWLKETEALPGYDAIADIKFTISASYDEEKNEVKDLKIIVNSHSTDGDNVEGVVNLGVVNNPGNTLPSTGGMGTTLFYVFGGLMAASALVMLVTKKRMAADC